MIAIGGQADFERRWRAADPALRRALAGRWAHAADRDDVLQEAALAAWRRRDWYDEARPFAAWAWGFARRCRALPPSGRLGGLAGAAAEQQAGDAAEEIEAALAEMPAGDAALLRAAHVDERPLALLAAEHGVSTRTLARRLQAARHRLRLLMSGLAGDTERLAAG